MKLDEGGDVLDVPGAMKLLGLGRNALYAGCASGEIPHRRIGKLLRFSRSVLLRWLEGDSAFRRRPDVRGSISCGRAAVQKEQ